MSTTFSANVTLDVMFNEIRASNGVKAGSDVGRIAELLNLATGTADNQINQAYAVQTSGIGATTTVYDLIGTLTDREGNTLNFDEVVLIAVKNLGSTATQYLTVGPDASNGFGVISSNVGFWAAALGSGGGSVVAADGGSWTVMYCKGGVPAAAGSTDELSIVTTGTANSWRLIILGRDN
jgi:hypothetical protein